jgi:hypothetical protein
MKEVRILDMPDEFNGTLFGKFEVFYKSQARRPDVLLRFIDTRTSKEGCGETLCYQWQPEARDLLRVSP